MAELFNDVHRHGTLHRDRIIVQDERTADAVSQGLKIADHVSGFHRKVEG